MGINVSPERTKTIQEKLAGTPDDKVSIDAVHEALDAFDVPRFAPNTGDTLSLAGRMGITLDKCAKLQASLDEALAMPVTVPEGESLNVARALLARSFKFLLAFDSTAELRQDIKLFMDAK